ncbi:hypothetical protein, partial [Streptomyces xiamenensis]|uniref:hypothetical protein n=1 Tax=Streptomyces xiamenensis TaxID=408015 RepID=UPI003D70BF66
MLLVHGFSFPPSPCTPHVALHGSDDAFDLGRWQGRDAQHVMSRGHVILTPVRRQPAGIEHGVV